MSDATQTPDPAEQAPMTPAEFLASLPDAPSSDLISQWKAQAPNGRIKVFTPDGKRAYILRGLSGLEMGQVQQNIPKNSTNPELDVQISSVVKAVLWTNTTQGNRLQDVTLRAASAGLPLTLFTLVSELSDFFDPARLEVMSGDL
jgi:DNA-binding NarL/FixJ family response regulator